MSMHEQSALLNILEKVYILHMHKLQDYINEYYSESAQLINLGLYKTKRSPKKAAMTSKVHSELSHTQLKDARRTRKPETAASELMKTSLRGSCILSSTPLNHLVDSEMRLSSHRSLAPAQHYVERSSSEPHAITQEGREPSVEAVTHRERKSHTAPSSQSDRNRTIAQTSKNLDSPDCATNVEISPLSHYSLTQVHANSTDCDNPKSDCQRLTRDGLKPSHHAKLESPMTHKIMRARGDTALMLSRAKPSKNLDVASEPRRSELKNVSPTPRGHTYDNRLSPRVRKLPDKEISELHGSYAVNNDVDSESVNKHSPLKSEAQAVPLHHMRSLQGFLQPYSELKWRTHSKSCMPHARKPPDKEISKLQAPHAVNHDADLTSVEKYSPSRPEAQTVPLRPTRSLQKLLDSHNELEWRAHHKPNTQLRVPKPPDKKDSELQRSYTVNSNVDSKSVEKHSPLKYEAPNVPLRSTRSLQKLLDSYQELGWRARSKSKPYTLSARKPPDKHAGREFLRGTLERAKGGLRSISNEASSSLLQPADPVPPRPLSPLDPVSPRSLSPPSRPYTPMTHNLDLPNHNPDQAGPDSAEDIEESDHIDDSDTNRTTDSDSESDDDNEDNTPAPPPSQSPAPVEGHQPQNPRLSSEDEPLPHAVLTQLSIPQDMMASVKSATLEDNIKDPDLLHQIRNPLSTTEELDPQMYTDIREALQWFDKRIVLDSYFVVKSRMEQLTGVFKVMTDMCPQGVTADVYTTCNKAQQRITSSRMLAATRGLRQWQGTPV
ncbi:hypothetical protein JOM56_015126 [Amanita muscaria]